MSTRPWEPILYAVSTVLPPTGDGADESDPLRMFLPTSRFIQALDPMAMLVLGDRGAGKSALFRVLAAGGLSTMQAVLRRPARTQSVPLIVSISRQDWPAQPVLVDLLHPLNEAQVQTFWSAVLVRRLLRAMPDLIPGWTANPAIVAPAALPSEWLNAALAAPEQIQRWLEVLDARLASSDQRLLVCIDELDRLAPSFTLIAPALRGLLAFWFDQRPRLRQVQPKIFLRVDLFSAEAIAFSDGAKFFRGHSVELTWDAPQLYRMWVKRLRNHPDDEARRAVHAWMQKESPKLTFTTVDGLGAIPDESRYRAAAPGEVMVIDETTSPLVYSLVGRWMGANPRKGDPYVWVPNHVQDGHRRLLPRQFLRLWSRAAELSLGERTFDGPLPMAPRHLMSAIARASEERMAEVTETDPWMEALPTCLEGLHIPATLEALCQRLDDCGWQYGRPPFESSEEVVKHLERRGVLWQRPDGRFAAPEIYLHALRMKRKGGVARI